MNLKVIINNLNQAIILKTEDDNIGYCNDFGLSIVHSISENLFENDNRVKKYIEQLGSMDFLMQNAFSDEKVNNSFDK